MSELNGDKNFIGFDKYTSFGAYHWDAINTNREYIAQSNIIIKEIIDNKANSILDIGCGDAAIIGKMALQFPNLMFCGFDAEKDAVSSGNKKIIDNNIKNVSLVNCNIEQAYAIYKSQSFEAIFSLDVIEHLPNPIELINFIKEVSTTNTKVILIGTPLFITEDLMSPYHVKEYSREELRDLFGKDNIKREWILQGNRKSKTTNKKQMYAESYYICSLN